MTIPYYLYVWKKSVKNVIVKKVLKNFILTNEIKKTVEWVFANCVTI